MSKKYKLKKKIKISESQNSSEKNNPPSPKKTKSSGNFNGSLIRFDKRTNIFIGILLLCYVLLSSLKIHTSNIGNWDTYFGLDRSESVIAGTPRFIRMDEWMIATPALMGQYELGLPLKNEANGDGNCPVVWGQPVKDISSILKPAIWSYFIFDLETSFSFSWNFSIFFFLISTFLLFMLIMRNNFWIAVFATFFIFLSAGLQWWSYLIGTYMIYLNGITIALIYVLYSKRFISWIISSLIFIVCAFSFISYLYPPFQVPLIYFYLFLIVGYVIREKNLAFIKENLFKKTMIFTGGLLILGIVGFHYYQIAKDTFSIMLNTVYPGRRFSTGGDLIDGKLFADFFGMYMNDTHVPSKWQNICEVSGALMFFPIVFYSLIYYYLKTKKYDPMLISISIYILIGLLYVLIGFPASLSKITLFSMTPSFRFLPVLAISNCILLVFYMNSEFTKLKNEKLSYVELGILGVFIFTFVLLVISNINRATDNFFTQKEIWVVGILVFVAYLLVRYKNFKYITPSLCFVLLIMTIRQIATNPLTKGLAPILDNPLTQVSKVIHNNDPNSRWALFGEIRITNLLKANGINILNGVKYVPALKDMQFLDRSRKNDSIYNRYSWVSMQPFFGANDTVYFQQTFNDGFTIYIDPCSPKLKQLNVKYYVFTYKPKDAEIRCMVPVRETAGLFIYKRSDLN